MTDTGDWSPDEPLGSETFEQRDEAIAENESLEANDDNGLEDAFPHDVSAVDERELEEAGVELDDPEQFAVLEGGMDDPDGLGEPPRLAELRSEDRGGWELDVEDSEDSAEE
jgi:hypothetical protein